MKKILVLITTFMFLTIGANAGINVGISVKQLDIETSGSEKLKTNNVGSMTKVSEDATVGTIFIEAQNDNGFAVGVEVIPGEAEIGAKTTSRTDKLTSGSSTVTQKAQAEISGHVTAYAILPVMSAGYLKLGAGSVDVETNETLGTGAAYGNASVSFGTVALGFQKTADNGLFFRGEVGYTDYEEVVLKSTGSDAASTIKGDISHTHGKISIGKAF